MSRTLDFAIGGCNADVLVDFIVLGIDRDGIERAACGAFRIAGILQLDLDSGNGIR